MYAAFMNERENNSGGVDSVNEINKFFNSNAQLYGQLYSQMSTQDSQNQQLGNKQNQFHH
jgi:hypothetical protein